MTTHRITISVLLLNLLVLLLGACTGISQTTDTTNTAQAKVGAITIDDAWARPSPLEGGNSAVYMVIGNGSAADERLVSAHTTAAAATETHETVDNDGVMSMVHKPEGFIIPAQGSIELKPGGKHIMLVNLTGLLAAGDAVELTLEFEHAGPVQLSVPVSDVSGQ